ncbi:phosphonate transport system permease protein [Natronincola peptidivorans]|uniref:Phosphonate transport system permease protein n=1 Tax=Natronincola peptidivorans TaxID=426128 RepID=A0A1I0A6I4_9FIRM|nr:phosphonate ABC transporter, permease protein PhnE [Natronincola peptidivorans]SES89794.1 phosphonate transport system permease protein [Natronincola peptidivorans]
MLSLIKKINNEWCLAIDIPKDWKSIFKIFFWIVLFLMTLTWSVKGTQFNLYRISLGIEGISDILSRMFPPNINIVSRLIKPTIETIQMSIVGTLLAITLSIPLGVLGARNITPNPLLYGVSRFILNALRAVPEVIFAIIFVSAVGLGPFPGTLAIGVSSSGMLGKFLGDSIENIDPGSLEALESTGANKIQAIVYAVIPQILPEFVSLGLFRWEMNFRASTILGIVGAGGIGFELMTSMRLFKYQEMTMTLIVILTVVALVDFIASTIRKKII